MTVLATCNSSPICCNRSLLIRKKLFDSFQIPDGYGYIDAPYFSYTDEDFLYEKYDDLAGQDLLLLRVKRYLDAKGPLIGSPFIFVCGTAHVRSTS
jgi:hypothetical protein